MSQQINLLLAELRPRRDWLALPLVAGAALAGLSIIVVAALWQQYRVRTFTELQQGVAAELQGLQQQVQGLNQQLAARQPNGALQAELEQMRAGLREREEALRQVEGGRLGSDSGYASVMQGFARQVMPGTWLTGFSIQDGSIEIRGRILDSAQLPAYIRKLNAEEAFHGRRFATLDMKSATLKKDGADASASYTEFQLRGVGMSAPQAEVRQ